MKELRIKCGSSIRSAVLTEVPLQPPKLNSQVTLPLQKQITACQFYRRESKCNRQLYPQLLWSYPTDFFPSIHSPMFTMEKTVPSTHTLQSVKVLALFPLTPHLFKPSPTSSPISKAASSRGPDTVSLSFMLHMLCASCYVLELSREGWQVSYA